MPGKAGDGKKGSQKPDTTPGSAGEPRSPGPEPEGDPKNQPSGPPRPLETARIAPSGDAKDRWGDLPQQVRDVFRTEGTSDLPAQYRDWIDAYYRRLNKQP